MRKFLMLVAIVGLALLVAVPAMALDFKFGAEYRVRFYDNVNFGSVGSGQPSLTLGKSDGANSYRGAQVRIRPRFDVSDDNGNITATLRLEIGDTEFGNGGGAPGVTNGVFLAPGGNRVGNGAGGSIGSDGVNVETKWAYVDFASPFGIPLRWRAGLQPWYEFKGIVIDEDLAGVRAYGKTGIVSYEAGWYRASAGTATSGATCTAGYACMTNTRNNYDDNYDFYEAKLGANIAKWLNPTVYFIYGDNRATNTTALTGTDVTKPVSAYFIGANFSGNPGPFSYDIDFVYGYANGGPNGNYTAMGDSRVKTKGWTIDAGVHIPVGPVLFHVVGSYATGDKQNGGDSEAMPYIDPSWNGAGGLYEIVGSGGVFDAVENSQDYPAGLWMLGGGAEYRPVKALWLRAMYGFVGFTSKRANCAYSSSKVNGACFGPSYGGDGYVAPTVGAGVAVPNGQGIGGIAGKSYLGHEINLRADYDLWTNFKIQANAGWLVPSEGDTMGEYVLQLLYNF